MFHTFYITSKGCTVFFSPEVLNWNFPIQKIKKFEETKSLTSFLKMFLFTSSLTFFEAIIFPSTVFIAAEFPV